MNMKVFSKLSLNDHMIPCWFYLGWLIWQYCHRCDLFYSAHILSCIYTIIWKPNTLKRKTLWKRWLQDSNAKLFSMCLGKKKFFLENHSSLFFSISQFFEGTLRCLSWSSIFLCCLFLFRQNCYFWCFHVSSEKKTNWLASQENISLEENKWWLLCFYITFMLVTSAQWMCLVLFFEEVYGSCLTILFIIAYSRKQAKRQLQIFDLGFILCFVSIALK